MSMSTLPIHAKSGRERGLVGARNGPAADINVTPLIDVLLVLLIIFMVILPPHELGEAALIPQPNTDTQPVKPDEAIVIQLKDSGSGQRPDLAINQQQVKWEELEGRLEDIIAPVRTARLL